MTEFQFEKNRVISFVDAVFSIAMTLLVLEISIPAYETVKTEGTLNILANLLPNFIGFFVSFIVIALYWVSHMRSMKFVSGINNNLLWLNVFLLLFIVLIPFSTSFYVEGFNLTGPFVFYCCNLSAVGFINFLIVRHIIKEKTDTSELSISTQKMLKHRALNSFSVWILAGLLAFVLPTLARYIFLLIFVIQAIINRKHKRNHES